MLKTLIVSTVLALTATASTAANIFDVSSRNGETVVNFVGNVQSGDAKTLKLLLSADRSITKINMMSPGGVAAEGFRIGEVLKQFNMTAYVPAGKYCISACAIAFLGAAEQQIDGALAFHKAYIPNPVPGADQNSYFTYGQQFGHDTLAYFLQNGINAQLNEIMFNHTSPGTFITFFHENQMKAWRGDTMAELFTPVVNPNVAWLDANILRTSTIYRYIGIIQ